MKKLLALCLILLVTSCSTTKTIKFSSTPDEIVKTESLKGFLTSNKNPKVVLRVNGTSENITDTENNDYLYNAIENQLLKSGFTVRDRQLFNQIIANEGNNIDYQKLKDKSDTDLIIELTKLESKILYETNKYFDQKGKEKIESEGFHKEYGASVEFKIVLIHTNEFAGVYEFNYTPCIDGCVISKSFSDIKKELKALKKKGVVPYEGVERNVLEDFVKNATIQLVLEMRK